MALARRKRVEIGATWCICENGAAGPTFAYDDLDAGFSAIFVSGPVERGLLVRSPHAERETNMWGFTRAALELLAECVAEATANEAAAAADPPPPLLQITEDRFGGVEVSVRPEACWEVSGFVEELHSNLEAWRVAGKRGVWLQLPLTCHAYVSAAVEAGFAYHHATADYLELTCWLPPTPSPLPRFAFTMIGVGGVVVNGAGEVLMVQEKVSPSARTQGAWKLPGGLADPGEDFAQTVAREVREETRVEATLDGVATMRHSHGRRFSQGDLYVVIRLRATSEAITIDPAELRAARWMSRAEIDKLKEGPEDAASLDGKVSTANYEMIQSALDGELIEGVTVPNSKGVGTMVYRARPRAAWVDMPCD